VVVGKKGTSFAYFGLFIPSLFLSVYSSHLALRDFQLIPRQLLTSSLKSVTITGCFVVGRRLDVQPENHL
jgi:hypothetical protein